MSAMHWLAKETVKGALRGVASYLVATYLIPIAALLATIAIGYVSDIPWFWIWLGALAAFAFVSLGLLRFDEWRIRQRTEDKLTFQGARVGKKLNKSGIVDGLCLGFSLHNSAVFPVSFQVESLQTQVAGRFPPKKPYDARQFTIPAGGNGWFDDFFIDLPDPRNNQIAEGYIEFVVKYGRINIMKYTLCKKLKIYFVFDDKGDTNISNLNEIT